jgi:hypothetical protein
METLLHDIVFHFIISEAKKQEAMPCFPEHLAE